MHRYGSSHHLHVVDITTYIITALPQILPYQTAKIVRRAKRSLKNIRNYVFFTRKETNKPYIHYSILQPSGK